MSTEDNSDDNQKQGLGKLRGLGAELWGSVDAQEYIESLRSEWDERLADQDYDDSEAG